MDTASARPGAGTRRAVEISWVPGTDLQGRPIMEMRWHVEDRTVALPTAA